MNIIQVATGVYPVPSNDRAAAIEKIVYELSLNLSRKGCSIHVIDVASKEREPSKIVFHEVDVGFFAAIPHKNLRALVFAFFSLFALLKTLKKTKVDIVHTHQAYSALVCMVVCRLFRNVYHFHTNHDPAIIMNAPSQKMLKSFSEVIVFKYSNHIVAETSTVKKQLMCRFKIPSRKITIIPMGVEESVLVQNAFDSSKTVVLCVGRIIPRKNQLTLIKAIPYVLAKHDKVKFIFAGPIEDKIYFQKIMGFIKEKNISKFVEFTGEISQEKLNALYREATIFAFPTLAETQGIVLLEAMSYGLPIVVSKIGPIMDITSGLQNSALLVNQESQCFAESINRLLSDNALRFELSSNARKLASAYSWDAVATRVLELYARLVIFNEKNSRNNV